MHHDIAIIIGPDSLLIDALADADLTDAEILHWVDEANLFLRLGREAPPALDREAARVEVLGDRTAAAWRSLAEAVRLSCSTVDLERALTDDE